MVPYTYIFKVFLKNVLQKERFLELILFLRNEKRNKFQYFFKEYKLELIFFFGNKDVYYYNKLFFKKKKKVLNYNVIKIYNCVLVSKSVVSND